MKVKKKTLRKMSRALAFMMAVVIVLTSLGLDSLVVNAAGTTDPTQIKPGMDVTPSSVLGEAINYGLVANDMTFHGHFETNFATKTLHTDINNEANGPKVDGFVGNIIIADYKDMQDQSGLMYDPNNATHRILEAEWISAFDDGNFKVVNANCSDYTSAPYGGDGDTQLAPLGYMHANVYVRRGAGNEDVTVNGNYFTFDGSSLPLIRTSAKGNAAGLIATYEIQQIHDAIFNNASDCILFANNMTVIGNTDNVSGASSTEGTGQAIAEEMRQTSGGIIGFLSYFYNNGLTDEKFLLHFAISLV